MDGGGLRLGDIELIVEITVAVVVFAVVFVGALVTLKPEHMGGEAGAARLGAAITGVVLGAIIGFAIVPLRVALADGGPPSEAQGLALPVSFIALVAFRRGAAGHAPVIGRPVRAYRKALLRRGIADSQKRLAKLEGRDGGPAEPG